ncbi:TonB-dependent receptor plug domain-containing protein [Chitinophaga japonensis]|uniref:Iron complex outermembrane receptor protein n=1 Tax=Chitinophaga japonensis TaxID=104662 RepID=A0A562ST94_CHIJA|nr:TonB-dependent receptor [Chitinophaga japonensis]TWI84432.1 iron complex outermembrane receptor protein [Chitinophaga japonensis]
MRTPSAIHLCCFFLLTFTAAFAQSKEDTSRITRLNEITVTASAMPVELRKVASSVTVLKASDPEMKQVQTIDDALSYMPGVSVNRGRGLTTTGSHTTVTLRGTGAAGRTLILKDGIPLNDTYTGGVNQWNSLATNSIARVEVVRGPGSSIYGSNSMGGTINLVTENPTLKPTFGADLRYGSMNTLIAGIKGGKAFRNGFGVIAFAEYKRTDGYQYMADSLWKSYYRKPTQELLNVNGKLSYQLNERSKLEGIVDYYMERPASGTATIYKENSRTNNYLLRYSGHNQLFEYNLSAYYNRIDQETDAVRWNNSEAAFNTPYYNSRVPVQVFGFIGKVSRTIWHNRITLGTDIRSSKLDSRKYYDGKGNQDYSGNQHFLSFFINDDVTIGSRLDLNVGLRYDNWQNNNGKFHDNQSGTDISIHYDNASSGVFSPKAGLVWHLSDQLRLRTVYAMGFKAPAMYYMYNATPLGSSFRLGNPDLKPERMVYSIEAGVDYSLGKVLELSGTAYASRYKDFLDAVLIDPAKVPDYFDPGGLPVRQYINIGQVNLHGVEASLRYKITPQLTAIASYFYNRSKITRYETNTAYEGNEVDDNPRHQVNGGLAFAGSRIVDVSLWLRYTGSSFSDLENSKDKMIGAYTVADIRAARKIGKFTVYGTMLNLFDKQYFGSYTSPTSYYLAPGRAVNLGVSYLL